MSYLFGVKLKKGASEDTREFNRQKLINEYKKTGRMGALIPEGLRDAIKWAEKLSIAFVKRAKIRGGSNATEGRKDDARSAEHTKIKGKLFGGANS